MEMRYLNFLLAAAAVCAAFFCFEVVWGESGVLAYNERRQVLEKLQNNIAELQQYNQALLADLHLLREDESFLLRYAAQAGYFREDQGLVKTEGNYAISHNWEIGRIQYIPPARSGGRPVRAGAAFIVGVGVYLMSAGFRREPQRRQLRLEIGGQSIHRAV
ncbi:septum formation initiator family protein [Spirochaeta africana]|uniref:Septum formation initiator n=1 Tax=Spirochaeta africana (strain ATCC 700263 / DSM 8902 / Z-7692) TaxID=889378 RepID=H9UJ05_SPIAZ|nr:septum formation initiator family protein [Spirochaeta africana]AFG37498.1 Septum formation initiator [Spirochaeta africana DSM 8902]